MAEKLKHRGVIHKGGRITIPDNVRKHLGIEGETFYELETYGKDKILITIIK